MNSCNKIQYVLNLFIMISAFWTGLYEYSFSSHNPVTDSVEKVAVTKQNPTFQELILERQNNTKEICRLLQPPEDDTKLIILVMTGDKSSLKVQDAVEKLKSNAREQAEAEHKIQVLNQRSEEIDTEILEAWVDLYRHRPKRDIFVQGIHLPMIDSIHAIQDMSKCSNVIYVPDHVETKAPQKFYTSFDEARGLWFCLELLEPTNVEWWRERLGWEATMQFSKNCEQDVKEMKEICTSEDPKFLDSRIEGFVQQRAIVIKNGFSETIMENEYELIALRSKHISNSSPEFKQGFQRYNPAREQTAEYCGAFRGFKCGLDRSQMVPTWVAYVTSKKGEGPAHLYQDVTSPDIKMAMTVTVGGPFYSPLGIFKGAIAQACDLQPCARLSIPTHSFVARTMGLIDPEIQYGITRPQNMMTKAFKSSGLQFTSFFGQNVSSAELPYLWKMGTKFILDDPRRDARYVISENHPFSNNYQLGGILLYDLEFPFVTFDREALSNIK